MKKNISLAAASVAGSPFSIKNSGREDIFSSGGFATDHAGAAPILGRDFSGVHVFFL